MHGVAQRAGTGPINRHAEPRRAASSFSAKGRYMDRRGFLGSLMAVTTTIASGENVIVTTTTTVVSAQAQAINLKGRK
jgi:hypothetical protein